MASTDATTDSFVPDASPLQQALARTTHLGIGAHPDDLEIMAFHGISACYNSSQDWFSGIVLCDGAGSPRAGEFADFSDQQMADTRRQEQRAAARLGRYSVQIQLGCASSALLPGHNTAVVAALVEQLTIARPRIVYLHNLADAHATHVNAALTCLQALRELEPAARPEQTWGVEVWRGLDWLPEPFRVELPIADSAGLQHQLISAHQSQVAGGKRYDRAVLARQTANATLGDPNAVDEHAACVLAMNLQPLLAEQPPSPAEYLAQCIASFATQVNLKR